jgi:invasion protein IalB
MLAAAWARTQADAQQAGKVKSSHGAWSIVCDTPAGAPASNAP